MFIPPAPSSSLGRSTSCRRPSPLPGGREAPRPSPSSSRRRQRPLPESAYFSSHWQSTARWRRRIQALEAAYGGGAWGRSWARGDNPGRAAAAALSPAPAPETSPNFLGTRLLFSVLFRGLCAKVWTCLLFQVFGPISVHTGYQTKYELNIFPTHTG
jgi:hypothetical protein